MRNVDFNQGTAKLRWRCASDPEEQISTIGFVHSGSGNEQTIAQEISEAWIASWPGPSMSNAWQFVGVSVDVGPEESRTHGEVNVVTQGTATWTTLPTNCALLVSKITASTGKGSRGRMFIPAAYLSEGEVDMNGFIVSAVHTPFQLNMNGFWDAPSDAGMPSVDSWCLFHGSTKPDTPLGSAASPITALSVQTQIATQRQRMRR